MENKLIRHKFDGLTKEVHDWECISFSSFYKKEFKSKNAEKEVLEGYLHAAESLYNCFKNDNNPIYGIKVFRTNQMCMPFLFLCRHTIELALKYALKYKYNIVKKGHNIKLLWKDLNINNDDFNLLVDVLNEIDNDGCKLRYSNDGKGNNYNEMPVFIKADLIIDITKKLCNYLLKLGE